MMKIEKTLRLNLSCYCCGGVDFELKEMAFNEVEDMYFLHSEDNPILKCSSCQLEDRLLNLVPRCFMHEKLINK